MNKLILDGAERLLEKGTVNFTIKELASEVPCARSAIYRAFPGGNRDVMNAVFELAVSEMDVALCDWLESVDFRAPRLRDSLMKAQSAFFRRTTVWGLMHRTYHQDYRLIHDAYSAELGNKITVTYPWILEPEALAYFLNSISVAVWDDYSAGLMKGIPDTHVLLDLVYKTWCHHLEISPISETRLLSPVLNQ